MKKMIALFLILVLLASPTAAFAEDAYATARTPLNGNAQHTANAELAAWSINQTQLRYGESFSFNNTVGPRTAERGYYRAVNGAGSETTGGGADQAASTLYLALLNLNNDGVAFTNVHSWGGSFAGSYVPDGRQALIVDHIIGTDFEFTNYAADVMFIEMWSSNGYLYCSVSTSNSDIGFHANSGSWFDSPNQTVPGIPQTVADARITCSGNGSVLTNVELAANSIYDTTLRTGDVFSFNAIVGPRQKEYGYVGAVNGRGARVTGGGVAQVASVVWLAIKDMEDISIVEKSTYGKRYNQTYVSSSADAILTDYKAGTDFAFRYTGEGSITIYTYLEASTLVCSIVKN